MTDSMAPAQFGPLSTLEHVDLTFRNVTDNDFVRIGEMPRLRSLTVTDRDLSPTACAGLAQSNTLEELTLSQCGFEEGAFEFIGKLRNLRILRINDTDIEDDDLAFLAPLQHLEELDLNSTTITDTGIAHLTQLQRLRTLNLSGTGATNAAIRSLRHLKLAALGVAYTEVDEDGLVELQTPEALQQLVIHGIRATIQLIPRLQGLRNLEQFYAWQTEVGAGFHVQTGWLESLRILWIDGARPGIGTELRKLTKLEGVDLRRSEVETADVYELAELPLLRELRLNKSTLDPNVVSALPRLRHLQTLDLSETNVSASQRTELTAQLPNVRLI